MQDAIGGLMCSLRSEAASPGGLLLWASAKLPPAAGAGEDCHSSVLMFRFAQLISASGSCGMGSMIA